KKVKNIKAKNVGQRVKTAKSRTNSSTNWLKRQLNDVYVHQAKIDGYRSRAAYKLLEIDEKFKILKPNQMVIELGAAPGGWSQIIQERIGKKGKLVGVDLLKINPINDVVFLEKDFNDEDIE